MKILLIIFLVALNPNFLIFQMPKPFNIHQVFIFKKTKIEIHPDFIHLNQLIKRFMNVKETFPSVTSNKPVTQCCNVCHSIKLLSLAQRCNASLLN
jgi:hypothetical protein